MVLLATAVLPRVAAAVSKDDDPAPSLSVELLLNAPDGASTQWDDLKGKVVVVDFWATWCAPCIASIPHLNELTEQFRGRDVVFISLTDEPRATVEPFLKRKPIKGWVALDTDHRAREAYGVSGIPHIFIVGRDGKILGDAHPGRLGPEHIEKALSGEPIGLESTGRDAAAGGDTVPAERRGPTYGGPFEPGRFPAVDAEKDVLPEPLAQLIVRPALVPEGGSSGGAAENRQTLLNCDATEMVKELYGRAYGVSTTRVELKATLPRQRLDVAIWAPPGDSQRFRRLVEAGLGGAFDLAARAEEREVDVLLLRATDAAARKPTPTVSTGGSMSRTRKEGNRDITTFINETTSGLADLLETLLEVPVIDQTGMMGGYDFELVTPKNVEDARESLGSLGLELIPGRRTLAYVVVERLAPE